MALALFWLDTLLCMAIKLKIKLWVSFISLIPQHYSLTLFISA